MSAVLAAVGCGMPVARDPDASADVASAFDAATQEAGSTCEQYCQCMRGVCSTLTTPGTSCLDWCASLSALERDCRVRLCTDLSNGSGVPSEVCSVVGARADQCTQPTASADGGR